MITERVLVTMTFATDAEVRLHMQQQCCDDWTFLWSANSQATSMKVHALGVVVGIGRDYWLAGGEQESLYVFSLEFIVNKVLKALITSLMCCVLSNLV